MDQNSHGQFLWILQMKNQVQVSALWIRGTLDPHPVWKTFLAPPQLQIQGVSHLQNQVKEHPSFVWCAVNDQKMRVLYMDAWDIRYVAILVQRNCGRNRQGAQSVDGRWSGLSKSFKPRIRNHDRRLAPCIKIVGFCFWFDLFTAVCCMYVGQKGCRKSTEDAWFIRKRRRRSSKLSEPWIKKCDKRLNPCNNIVSFCFWVEFCYNLAFNAWSNDSGVQANLCFQNSVLKNTLTKELNQISSHLQIDAICICSSIHYNQSFIFYNVQHYIIILFIKMIKNQWINSDKLAYIHTHFFLFSCFALIRWLTQWLCSIKSAFHKEKLKVEAKQVNWKSTKYSRNTTAFMTRFFPSFFGWGMGKSWKLKRTQQKSHWFKFRI